MNHYDRHIGDYIRKTVGLSMLEEGAYTRLLDQYYVTEAPLPLDMERVYRLGRATSRAERQAVDNIIAEFFTRTEEGYRQNRAEDELQAIYSRSDSARKSAEQRWKRKRNANAMRTHSERNAEGHANAMRNGCVSDATQDPVPSTQNKAKSKALFDSPEKPSAESNPDPPNRQIAKDLLARLNRLTNHHFKDVPANIDPIVSRLKEGYTEREIRVVIANKCAEWKHDEKMAQYARPKTLFNRTNFANYAGEVPAAGVVDDGA